MASTTNGLLAPTTTRDAPMTPTPTVYGPFYTLPEAAGGQAVNRSSLAALAFLVWDIFITFDDEVTYIWPRSWSFTKFVYLIVRYLPVMIEASILCIGTELTPRFHFTQHDCFIWQVYQAAAITLIIVAVDTILILRVFALFKNSPITRTIIKLAFVGEVTSMISGIVLAAPKIQYNDVCLVVHAPMIFGLWLTSLFFQALLFALTTYRFFSTISGGLGNVSLILIVMRDGTWAFLLLFLIYVGYAITVLVLGHSYFAGVLFGWLLAAFSFAGYRIILNLHHFGSTQLNHRTAERPSNHTHQTGADIQFTSYPLSTITESPELYLANRSRTLRTAGQTSGLSSISELRLDS